MNVKQLVRNFSLKDNKQTIDAIFEASGALILLRHCSVDYVSDDILCYIPSDLIDMIEHDYNYERGSKKWTSVIANLPVEFDMVHEFYRAYFKPLCILSFNKEEPGFVAMQPNFVDGDYD